MTKEIKKIMTGTSNLKPYQPGDARINRRGRPRKYDAIAQLAKEIGYEPVDIRKDGLAMSRAEAILRDWFSSKNFQKQLAAMQYAFGKVPDKIQLNDERSVIIVEWEEEETMVALEELYNKANLLENGDNGNTGGNTEGEPPPGAAAGS